MTACEQAPGMNMLQHGEAVHIEYLKLINELESGAHECDKLIAAWRELRSQIPLLETLCQYHIYHDCGKHLCLTIDANGKRHFPNHAEMSAKQYAHLFPEDGFTTALIRRDMDFHCLRGNDLIQLWKSPFAPPLYFTAWAEINANAKMFGGRQSESYKIKRSRLIKALNKRK